MNLSAITISAIDFDNRFFTRQLTATLFNVQGTATVVATGNNLIAWSLPSYAWAVTKTGAIYNTNTILPVSSIGTLNISFTADYYDPTQVGPTISTFSLGCSSYNPPQLTAFPDIFTDIYGESVSLLLPCDDVIDNQVIDSSQYRKVFSRKAGASIQSAEKKFGSGSLFLDGSVNGFVDTPIDVWYDLGRNDFTVECWFYSTETPSTLSRKSRLIGLGNGKNQSLNFTTGWSLLLEPLSGISWYRYRNNADDTYTNEYSISATSISIPLSTWHHVAVVRDNNNVKIFFNGTQVHSEFTTAEYSRVTNIDTLQIGRIVLENTALSSTNTQNFQGYIDDVRITKGVARYTTSFTPGLEYRKPRETTEFDEIQFDTFPDVDFNLFINYENSNNNSLFYRLVSSTPYSASILLTSTDYNFKTQLTSTKHLAWFLLNDATTPLYQLSGLYSFDRQVTCLSAVYAFVSGLSSPDSVQPWFTPHIIQKSLSAQFVPEFPTATFVVYPSTYFQTPQNYERLFPNDEDKISSNFEDSPGAWFYGEGHTENMFLCAASVSGVDTYVWLINNSQSLYPITYQLSSFAFITLSSDIGFYPRLPVSLVLTNSIFSVNSPRYQLNDVTGQPEYYPFYATTVDLLGNERPTNNYLFESIEVRPYSTVFSIDFKPGIAPVVYLPVNGSTIQYEASLRVFINNANALSACYDKFDTIWKWSEFTSLTGLTGIPTGEELYNYINTTGYTPCSALGSPISSWVTVSCADVNNIFAKTWANQGIDNPVSDTPIVCELSGISWSLSAYTETPFKQWGEPLHFNALGINNYTYSLQLSEYGGDTEELFNFSASRYGDTFITLKATQSALCIIDGIELGGVGSGQFVNDWKPKITEIIQIQNTISVKPYETAVYIPNKYVLANTPILVQNVSRGLLPPVSAIIIQYDDDPVRTITLTGSNVNNNFTITYPTIGSKTLKIAARSAFYNEEFVQEFPNLIQVVDGYDIVIPEGYFSFNSILEDLPWKQKPQIGANDWVVSDNINSCIKKFQENLLFLDSRSNTYPEIPNEYIGWLGSQPSSLIEISACNLWTWEDLDCSLPTNRLPITWSRVMSGGVIPEVVETGDLAICGTWVQQTCPTEIFSPNCLQRHCVEWRWASRKSVNSTALVTWKSAKCDGRFAKRWRFEPCENVASLNCDQGIWNVNIPNINQYYEPIPVCFAQGRCTYNAIISDNNIIFAGLDTQIKVLSGDYSATFFDFRGTLNEVTPFVNIKALAFDNKKTLYILDGTLSQVAVYEYNKTSPGERWSLFTTFGGIGGSLSKTKFLNPNDLHVDQNGSVWVVDTGNSVIKQYSNTGGWVQTLRDEYFIENPPISLCVDSQNNVHILTTNSVIRVYSYTGTFNFEYTPRNVSFNVNNFNGVRIKTNYNRELIYILSRTEVIRHFRTGTYSGVIVSNKPCVDNITDLYQDEYRNLLITTGDKILKYVDIMTPVPVKSVLPKEFWSLNDIIIHEDEYVQNWVYTKAFHRLWDNIEIFKNSLLYEDNPVSCKKYKPAKYTKEQITIGQNELVTSTAINRVLDYLWANFEILLEYYNSNC